MNEEVAEKTDYFFLVLGIRHNAIVRLDELEPEKAIKKAIEHGSIGDWEYPESIFIGSKMPDVFSC